MSEIATNDNSCDSTSKTAKTNHSEDSSEHNSEVEKYIQQLSESERKTYEIANQHLESSFSVEKSIGYLKWKSK